MMPADSRLRASPSDDRAAITRLTSDLVAIDSRSSLSNLAIAERIEAELAGFELERLAS